jgi:hypothetical protein
LSFRERQIIAHQEKHSRVGNDLRPVERIALRPPQNYLFVQFAFDLGEQRFSVQAIVERQIRSANERR